MKTNVPDQSLKSKFVPDVKFITNIFLKKESIYFQIVYVKEWRLFVLYVMSKIFAS